MIYTAHTVPSAEQGRAWRVSGFGPLAEWLLLRPETGDPLERAAEYVNLEAGVASAEEALAGARDIVAEILDR